MANEEKKDVTGLSQATNKKETEYDLVTALLEAADYKISDEVTPIDLKRNGKFIFTVNVRPLSDDEIRTARKKATIYMPNPNNKKLPPVEKEFDYVAFKSWFIYLATTDEDREKIWGNKVIKDKYGLKLPVEAVDVLLKTGEKDSIIDVIRRISCIDDDYDDETIDEEEYAKN